MQVTLSSILDYSIETGSVSVMNYGDCTVYFIPYDGTLFEELLASLPNAAFESELYSDENSDSLDFSILCQYSHIDADNRLNIKYELRLGDALLATEFASMPNKQSEKKPAKPNTLLYSAEKCARKIIIQERQALKQGMLKTLRTGFEYES